jgi:hypothetical protein
MAQTFETFIEQERERLAKERDTIRAQQQALEKQLTTISRELAAVEAYEAAKHGKTSSQPRPRRAPQSRRGSKRDALLGVIRGNPGGLTRGEILDKMGLKGDKSGAMSVSNALTALSKANQVVRRDGRYIAHEGMTA